MLRRASAAIGPQLDAFLRAAAPTVVDVGARGGAWRPLNLLAPYGRLVMCDPDLGADLPAGDWRETTVIPAALGPEEGEVDLHLTAVPGFSSTLPPDLDAARTVGLDWAMEVVGTERVACMTLDEAAVRYDFADASFVKLDTQGTELGILRSGPALMRQVAGVRVEAMFLPIYRGQPMFADTDAHLRGLGFTIVDLDRSLHRRGGFDASVGSRRQPTWCHATYLRLDADPLRLLPLALAVGHVDLALELAEPDVAADIRRLAPPADSKHFWKDARA